MLRDKLQGHKIILASGSPRRQQFLKELDLDFEIRLKEVDEVYPAHLKCSEIARFLSELKAKPFEGQLKNNEILITSDTVVWHDGNSLAKAKNTAEAIEMINALSGDWHKVITAVTFTTSQTQNTVHEVTEVKFKALTAAEIEHYVDTFKPFDKAGAYGIQDWIGLIAIEEIKGSYTNVVGLPTHLVYKTLMHMVR